MGGAPALWNVSILPRNDRFEITTIWDSMKDKVAFGDQVININGYFFGRLSHEPNGCGRYHERHPAVIPVILLSRKTKNRRKIKTRKEK